MDEEVRFPLQNPRTLRVKHSFTLNFLYNLSNTDPLCYNHFTSPAELFAREGNSYAQAADVLVSSDCLSQEIDEAMVSHTRLLALFFALEIE